MILQIDTELCSAQKDAHILEYKPCPPIYLGLGFGFGFAFLSVFLLFNIFHMRHARPYWCWNLHIALAVFV